MPGTWQNYRSSFQQEKNFALFEILYCVCSQESIINELKEPPEGPGFRPEERDVTKRTTQQVPMSKGKRIKELRQNTLIFFQMCC